MSFLIFITIWYLAGLAAVYYACRPFRKQMERAERIEALTVALFGPVLWFLILLDKIVDIWSDGDDKDYKS